jgi:hypothetical protein
MKKLTVALSVAAAIVLAAPAHADGDDDAFLAALTKAGITYKNADKAVSAGQKVCDLASGGTSQTEILRQVRDVNPGFTMASAAKFVQAAASVYCPDRLSTDDGGTATGGSNGGSGGGK